ncbi:fibronectin type III domain-containing protein [Cohnella fermenti]|uniref:Fibronectin type III domain-containing protein n=1 Tax=Cohnella fermenti TaxID=2565925 RepID=A0A4S4BZZ8_9BACL|nr:fibronectin type III domain-containing protein [Cohnella fermenti]THF80860.1 fibronectin type III domain-containing protein [Cohnella fermenti]
MALKLNGTNSVILQWTQAAGATSIILQKSTNGTTWTTASSVAKTATQVTAAGLAGNTTYYFRLLITGGTNNGYSNEIVVTTYGLKSTTLKSTNVTDTTATLSWSTVPGASSLVIEQSVDGGSTWTAAETGALAGTATTATVTGLSAKTTYKFRLAVTGGTYGTAGGNNNNVVTVTTTTTPVTLTLGETGATTVGLAWTTATGASSIQVQQSTNGTTWVSAKTSATLTAASTEATVTGLIGGTKYYFRVLVVGGTFAGYSAAVNTTTGTEPNETLALKLNGTNSVILQWTQAAGATSIILQKSTNGTTWTTASSVAKTATQVTATGLTSHTTYYFRLLITGGTNNGYSNEIEVTTVSVPISNFRAVVNSSTGVVTFYWNKAGGSVESIRVEEKIGDVWSSVATGVISTSAASATLVVTPGGTTTHFYRLYVVGGTNDGASNVIQVIH